MAGSISFVYIPADGGRGAAVRGGKTQQKKSNRGEGGRIGGTETHHFGLCEVVCGMYVGEEKVNNRSKSYLPWDIKQDEEKDREES